MSTGVLAPPLGCRKGETAGRLGCYDLRRLRIRQEKKGFPTARKTSMQNETSRGQGISGAAHAGLFNQVIEEGRSEAEQAGCGAHKDREHCQGCVTEVIATDCIQDTG